MGKKFVAVMLAVIGIASASNAGTEVIQDYGRDQYNTYAPRPLPPPRPVYYVPPPPPIYFSIFPAYGYHGPRFGYRRVYAHRYHHWH